MQNSNNNNNNSNNNNNNSNLPRILHPEARRLLKEIETHNFFAESLIDQEEAEQFRRLTKVFQYKLDRYLRG